MSGYSDDFFTAPPAPADGEAPAVVYDFTVDLNDPYQLQTEHPQANWKQIGILSGAAVFLLALAAVFLSILWPGWHRSAPVRTAIQYYGFLNKEDYTSAYELLEPGTQSQLQFENNVLEMVKTFVAWDVAYEWDFISMKYQSQELAPGVYQVMADGYIRITDVQTERFMDLPYSAPLQILKRNSHWVIRP